MDVLSAIRFEEPQLWGAGVSQSPHPAETVYGGPYMCLHSRLMARRVPINDLAYVNNLPSFHLFRPTSGRILYARPF